MEGDRLLEVEIVTPQKTVFTGSAQSVTVPGTMGPFQVLYNHAPIVSSLDLGLVSLVDEKMKSKHFATGTGFAEVRRNKVSILVEFSNEASEIDTEEVLKQINAQKELLKTLKEDDASAAKKAIAEGENRLKAAGKLRS